MMRFCDGSYAGFGFRVGKKWSFLLFKGVGGGIFEWFGVSTYRSERFRAVRVSILNRMLRIELEI